MNMDRLYTLIKSLDKSEKRYYKIFASRHIIKGSKHEIELFNIIERLKNPDDQKVKASVKSRQLLEHFSIHKHLLYKNLLKCLNAYHSGKSAEDEILELYKSSKILFEKCLFEESNKLIEKAKNIALKNECFNLYLMLAETENFFYETHFDLKSFEEKILKETQNELNISEKQQNLIHFRETGNLLHYYAKRYGVMDKNLNLQYWPELPDITLIENEKSARSEKAKLLLWKIQSLIAYRNADYKLSSVYENKILTLLGSKDDDYPFKTMEIILSYNRNIWNYFMSGDSSNVNAILSKVYAIPDTSRSVRLIKFQLFINYELLNKINTGNIKGADEIEQKIQQHYDEFGNAISLQKKMIFNFNLALLFFVAGNYNKSQKWLNTLLENINKKIDTDIMISARITNIILQYEQNMHSLIKYSVLSAKRYIRKIRPLSNFDNLFFNTIIRLSEYNTEDVKMKILKHFKKELQQIIRSGQSYDRCFPYYQWVESKIEKTPLEKVIHETNVLGKRSDFN
jgi:hypothetical protein